MTRVRSKSSFFQRTKMGQYYYKVSGTLGTAVYLDWTGLAATRDYCSDGTAPGPPYKWVNPLYIEHYYKGGYNRTVSGDVWVMKTGILEQRYSGNFYASMGMTAPVLYGSALAYANTSMDALGATGWKKFQPAKPIADMGVFLGESRELPRQFSDAVKALKALATHPLKTVRNMSWLSNQHLAMQFGWLPLMRDLEKFYKALQNTDSWLSRVKKHNGKWERRGGVVASGSGSDVVGSGFIYPGPSGYAAPPEGTSYGDIRVTWDYKVWFSALFKYYVADFDSPKTQLRLKSRIWGLNNTPLVVWNLLPWSWLVDWFSNVGDNIENLLPIDGLVAKMACVMRHCRTRYDLQVSQRYKEPNGSFITISASNYEEVESKGRTVASPFGFGLTWDQLSSRQLSILAALGVQRLPRP